MFLSKESKENNWAADAFLNLRLPKAGKEVKLGAIALRLNKRADKDIIEFLKANPEDGLERIKDALILDIHIVGESEGEPAQFDF